MSWPCALKLAGLPVLMIQWLVTIARRLQRWDSPVQIVARLGGAATMAAVDADIVVTEQGVARLRDATISQRVRRMLMIAAPEDREGLERAARANRWLR